MNQKGVPEYAIFSSMNIYGNVGYLNWFITPCAIWLNKPHPNQKYTMRCFSNRCQLPLPINLGG